MFLHKMLIQQQCVKLNYKHLPERGSYIDLHNWNPSLDGLFPGGSVSNESTCNAEDLVSIPGLGSSPGERNGNPFQCSCLENSMDRTEKLSFFPLHHSGFEKETKQSASMVSWVRNLTLCVCVCVCVCGNGGNWQKHPSFLPTYKQVIWHSSLRPETLGLNHSCLPY